MAGCMPTETSSLFDAESGMSKGRKTSVSFVCLFDERVELKLFWKIQVLECRVCDNVFGLQGDKTPRLLFCGHTLCHSCLTRLPHSPGNEQPDFNQQLVIQCPFDRQPTSLGPNGVWDLKKNFALLELLERLELDEAKDKSTFSQSFFEQERQLSVCCDENEEHTAVFYCTTCATHLCEKVRFRSTSMDEIFDADFFGISVLGFNSWDPDISQASSYPLIGKTPRETQMPISYITRHWIHLSGERMPMFAFDVLHL